ncbi:MAG: cadmium-translocating P-type ATPase [Clostridiales bacterium]|nr:cadmium-translocating P-type ATPase [Clostridiales bacterium]
MIKERLRKSIFRLPPFLLVAICAVVSALLFATGLFIPAAPWLKCFIFISCVILTGYDIVIDTVTKLIREAEFNAGFLVVLAAAGAFGIHKGAEGAAVLLIFRIGELAHNMLVRRSANAIESFVDLRSETVNAVINGAIVQMAPGKINVGDIISVSPGEHIALDGIVVSGDSQINTSALNGDTEPLQVAEGSKVLSGSVNLTGVLNIQVTADFDHSTVSRILQLLEESENRKAEPEKKIIKIARIYAPASAAAALILGILVPLFGGLPLTPWLNRAFGILVVASPAAFLASVSLTYFAGSGGATKNGIIFKGADVIDTISHTTSVIFDKTGTLTDGMFRVVAIHACGIPENRLLMLATYAELFSAHPIGRAIVEAAGITPDFAKVTDYRELTGKGTEIMIDGNTITAGSALLMKELGVKYDISKDEYSAVYIAVNGRYAGRILLSDNIRPDSKKAVRDLRTIGIDRIAIFTGDKKEAAADAAGQLGIKEYYAECLPEDKFTRLKGLLDMQLKGDKLIYAGNGIDDAPILKMADVGITIGGLISDETTDAADMIIMSDEPSKIAAAVTLARNTDKIVRQNVVLALAWKGLLLLLTALGIAPVWCAALADAALAVVVILNAGQAFKVKEPLRKHKR